MNAAARLTIAEAAIARLSASRGPKVSAMLREARVRSQRGEPAPIILHGLMGRMIEGGELRQRIETIEQKLAELAGP